MGRLFLGTAALIAALSGCESPGKHVEQAREPAPATPGTIQQTQYRSGGGSGVRQAGGVVPDVGPGGGVVPAVGSYPAPPQQFMR